MSKLFSFILAGLFAVVAGCGDPNGGRLPISGTVKLDGKNLDNGMIMFVPVAADTPTQGSAQITNGAYAISLEQGLVPGKYKVSISAPDGKTPDGNSTAAPGPSGNFASKDRIPPKFNQNSTLEVEVKKGQPNVFNYEIP